MSLTNIPDIGNALFEVGGAGFLTINVRKLWQDKKLRGVSILPTMFFTGWGYWNIFFYPATGNIASGVAAGLVALVNSTWVYLAYKYRKN